MMLLFEISLAISQISRR